MHSSHDHPHREEASSTHDPPQVVVRAGKTYLCSSCGTLIEIPADVVEQYVLVPASAEAAEKENAANGNAEKRPLPRQATPSSSCSTSTASGGDTTTMSQPTTSPESERRLPLPSRPKRPRRPSFAHQKIDGLRVPSSSEMDRAFHWVSYQLKVLDRKESEIRRLRKLLKQTVKEPTPQRRPVRPQCAGEVPDERPQRHAYEDVGMAPESQTPDSTHAHQRAPP